MTTTTQDKERSYPGSIKGIVTPRPNEKVDLPIRIFTLMDGRVGVDGFRLSAGRNAKAVFLEFPGNISNGKHDFTKDGPITRISYTEGPFHDSPSFEGVKNGKGYVEIKFNRQEGTLFAKIVNVDLKEKHGDIELKLNVTIEAKDLLDQD
ncbi:hypothetical protein ACIP86_11420 [Pseudomonas neuropathica]